MTVEEIKALPIREVIRKCGTEVNSKGFCLCPAHSEKTGSCKVYDKTNTWYCFGCHAHGDNIDFAMASLNCGFEEAFKYLGGTHGEQKPSDRLKALRLRLESKKRKEKKEAEQSERRRAHKRIHDLNRIAESAEPFSDEWCAAVNEAEKIKTELGLYDD